MQHRIFRIGGEPVVAARDGFFETHGTLAALIERHRPGAPDRIAGAEVVPIPAQVAPDKEASGLVLLAPEPAAAQPEVARPEQDGRDGIAAKPRKARTLRSKPPPGSTEAVVAGIAAKPSEVEAAAAGSEAVETPRWRARAPGRRAGQPTPPRWMVAGKRRRGRPT